MHKHVIYTFLETQNIKVEKQEYFVLYNIKHTYK